MRLHLVAVKLHLKYMRWSLATHLDYKISNSYIYQDF
jgi:hypothetical protein